MRINISAAKKAIANVRKAVKKSPNPVLMNVLVRTDKDTCNLIGTDLETTIIEKLAIERPESFTALMDVNILNRILGQNKEDADSTLLMSMQDKTVELEAACAKYRIPIYHDAANFPDVPEKPVGKECTATIGATEIGAMSVLKKSQDLQKSSIFFKQNEIMSTDGYRLYRLKCDCSIIAALPCAAAPVLADMMESDLVCHAHNSFYHQTETGLVFVRANEGVAFDSNLDAIMNTDKKTSVEVDRVQFIEALGRIGAVLPQSVKLNGHDNMLELTASTEHGEAEEMFPASVNGKNVITSFNPEFLVSTLNFFTKQFVTLNIGQPTDAIYITSVDEPEKDAAVMPMRSE